MSPNKEPPSLLLLALSQVEKDIYSVCRSLQRQAKIYSSVTNLPNQTKAHRKHLIQLPASVRCELIERIFQRLLNATDTDRFYDRTYPTSLYVLEVLLTNDVRFLRLRLFNYYSATHQDELLKVLSKHGSGVMLLELVGSKWSSSGGSVIPPDPSLFRSLALRLSRLRKLGLKYIASNEILKIIGLCCDQLQMLDISESDKVTDDGLTDLVQRPFIYSYKVILDSDDEGPGKKQRIEQSLSEIAILHPSSIQLLPVDSSRCYEGQRNPVCNTLRVLNIKCTAITNEGMLCIFRSIKFLEFLDTSDGIEKPLELLRSEWSYRRKSNSDLPHPRLNLSSIYCRHLSDEALKLFASTCPRLKKMKGEFPRITPGAFRTVPPVTFLYFTFIPVESLWVASDKAFLKDCGKNFADLVLHSHDQNFQLNLALIVKYCPNLRSMIMEFSHILWDQDRRRTSQKPLRKLRCVRLGQQATERAVVNLLGLAPNLSRFHLYSCVDAGPNFLSDLVSHNLPKRIECFYLYLGVILNNADEARNFVAHNEYLRTIGNIDGVINVSNERQWIESFGLGKNLDLQLARFNHWFSRECFAEVGYHD